MKYALKERVWSLRDEYTINDDQERPVWTVKGRVLSWGKQLSLSDREGREIARIQQRMMSMWPKFDIEREGQPTAQVCKRWAWFKDRFTVQVDGRVRYQVEGNFLQRDYQFVRDGGTAASVSRALFSLSDTYGVETAPDEDDLLILASVVVIDLARQSDANVGVIGG